MFLFFGVFTTILLVSFWKKDYVKEKIHNLKRLYQSSCSIALKKNKNPILITIETLYDILCLNIYQYLNRSVIKINKNTCEVRYIIDGKLYIYKVKIKRGPNFIVNITTIKNGKINYVTNEIIKYFGPMHDWHYMEYSPLDFGYDELTFELNNGKIKSFTTNEKIII